MTDQLWKDSTFNIPSLLPLQAVPQEPDPGKMLTYLQALHNYLADDRQKIARAINVVSYYRSLFGIDADEPDLSKAGLELASPIFWVSEDTLIPKLATDISGTPTWEPLNIDADNIIGDFEYIDFETGPYTGGHQEGRLHWDSDAGTLSLGMPGGEVELQIGQEHIVRCRNTTGVEIPNGSVVYVTGASGNKPLIALSKADDKLTAIVFGVTTEAIDHNSNGYVTTIGLVREIDSSAFSEGDYMFLSDSVAGGFSTTPATAPNYKARVGYCLRAHANEGVMYVTSAVVPNLMSLSDVYGAPSVDGQFYAWDETGDSRFELLNINDYVPRSEWLQNGFADKSEVAMTWDSVTRVLRIEPSGREINYYHDGIHYVEENYIEAAQIADAEGLYVFYISAEGIMSSSLNPSHGDVDRVIDNECIVAYVYWDAANNEGRLMNELHGSRMSPATHHYLHDNFGAQYFDGMTVADIDVDENGTLDAHAQFSVSAGEFYDEDLGQDIAASGQTDTKEVYYVDGSGYTRWIDAEATFPVAAIGGVIAYNNAGTLTPVSNNKYCLYHVFATNIKTDADADYPIIMVPGEAEYLTKALARDAAATEIADLTTGSWPVEETVPIATVIYQHKGSMSNGVEATTISTDTGDDYIDWRSSQATGSGGSASDHGLLSGLSDDDHSQYLLIDGTRAMTGSLETHGGSASDLDVKIGATDTGFYRLSGDIVSFAYQGSERLRYDWGNARVYLPGEASGHYFQGGWRSLNSTFGSGSSLDVHAAWDLQWSEDAFYWGAKDLGLARSAAGILKVTDGSTGFGNLVVGGGVASAPALQFGDGDTGFYEDIDDRLNVAIGGGKAWVFNNNLNGFQCGLGGGPGLMLQVASATLPTFVPNNNDTDTGIGQNAADELSLICGATEVMRLTTTTGLLNGDLYIEDAVAPALFMREGGSASSYSYIQDSGSSCEIEKVDAFACNLDLNCVATNTDDVKIRMFYGGAGGGEGTLEIYNGASGPPVLLNEFNGDGTIHLCQTGGNATIDGSLYIERATNPSIYLREAGDTDDYSLFVDNGGDLRIRRYDSDGHAYIYYEADSDHASGVGIHNFNRFSNNVSGTIIRIFDGDGSTSYNHQIRDSGNDTELCRLGGDLIIGEGNLYLDKASNPSISLREGGATGYYTRMEDQTANNAKIEKYVTVGTALLDLNATPADGTSATTIRMFRNANTTGTAQFQILEGDGTASANHVLSGNSGDANLCVQGGKVICGSERVRLPYLGAAPSSLVNGDMWMESDGLHIYYGGAEKTVAGV